MTDRVVMAVDVGTGSARAGLFDAGGRMLARDSRPIALNRPAQDHAEQDSEDIWRAVCEAAGAAREQAGVPPEAIAGISFDATCSLVALDAADRPASISTSGEARWNVVVWMDHRAIAEAQACTATGHRVLDFVGGTMSPEMEIPKLMWLKRHLPERWGQYGRILDLADFLTWRACGSNARSCCTVTCKWTYLAHEIPGWQADFLAGVGLDDLLERAGLPGTASPIGAALGTLTPQAAADLGLTTACQVGCGLIDAHAGALGVLGEVLDQGERALDRHIGLVAGTSTCHMALSAAPRMVQGVWGPYYGAVAPGLWLNEGGQSVTGALLDHILSWHAEGRALGPPGAEAHAGVIARIRELAVREPGPSRLHVLPDFHGNRSPLADPHALGVISGLSLDASFDSLARLYERTAVGHRAGHPPHPRCPERHGLRDRPPAHHRRPHQQLAADGAVRRRDRLHRGDRRRGGRGAARHRDGRRHRRRPVPRSRRRRRGDGARGPGDRARPRQGRDATIATTASSSPCTSTAGHSTRSREPASPGAERLNEFLRLR